MTAEIITKHIAITRLAFWVTASRWTLEDLRTGTNWTGTKEDFLVALRADPRTYFVSEECDSTDETGQCRGHRVPEAVKSLARTRRAL